MKKQSTVPLISKPIPPQNTPNRPDPDEACLNQYLTSNFAKMGQRDSSLNGYIPEISCSLGQSSLKDTKNDNIGWVKTSKIVLNTIKERDWSVKGAKCEAGHEMSYVPPHSPEDNIKYSYRHCGLKELQKQCLGYYACQHADCSPQVAHKYC